jgi:hypothetical protein
VFLTAALIEAYLCHVSNTTRRNLGTWRIWLVKNDVFWDVTPCGSCGTYVSKELSSSFIRRTRIGVLGTTLAVISNRRMLWLLVTASVVPSSLILVTLKMEALRSSETSVLTRATQRNIPEDAILHNLAGFCSGDIMCLLWGTNWVFISQKTTIFIVTVVKT